MTGRRPRVVVVGGGVAGLTVAYRLTRTGGEPDGGSDPPFDVTVLEASDRLGGSIRSIELDGFEVEAGPDSFVVRKPWALELCRELGLEGNLVHPGSSGALVWARGRLVPYPAGSAFGIPPDAESLLRWPGLSVRGRLRAVTDLWRPGRPSPGDESIGSLVTRRLGGECASVMVGPLLAGINSGDPDRLSVRATFPELIRWEEAHGSLIRGSRAVRRVARGGGGGGAEPLFASLRGGLSRLVEALSARLGPVAVSLGSAADGLSVGPGSAEGSAQNESPFEPTLRVIVRTAGSALAASLNADAVVFATPAHTTADLVGTANPEAARELAGIPYGSSALVALAYPAGTAQRLPEATGFIVPAGSTAGGRRLAVTACTWLSRKWPDPRFGDRAVVRVFVGRAGDDDALTATDPELVATVAHDLDAIAPLGAAPDAAAVARWPRSMPQYEVGHLDRVERIEAALARTPGVFVTGSAYRGVGIADVVHQANETAERVRAFLSRTTADRIDGTRASIR